MKQVYFSKTTLILLLFCAGIYIGCKTERTDVRPTFTNDPLNHSNPDTTGGGGTDTTNACDTVDVSFAMNVLPIFQQHCVSCHNPTYTGGSGGGSGSGSGSGGETGLEPYLTSYAEIIDAMSDDPWEFFEMLNHTGEEDPMPPTYKLTDCELRIIEIWYSNGMPNN